MGHKNFFLTLVLCMSTIAGLSGCATYQSELKASRELAEKGDWAGAANEIREKAFKESRDQLVFLLDYATLRHYQGDYKESNRAFLQADKLAEHLDYISVSDKATSFIVTEELKAYQGDTFEKIFINAYLAMNYLKMGDLENALVEARRLNEKYLSLRREGDQKNYQQNFFGKYLSALLWEANGDFADAFIAYKEAFAIDPSVKYLPEDLVRTAFLSRRTEDLKLMREQFPQVEMRNEWKKKNFGELIFIFDQGWGPRKDFAPGNHKLPTLVRQRHQTSKAVLALETQASLETQMIYDVADSAIKTLAEDLPILAAKRIAAQVVRDSIAFNQKSKKREDQVATLLTWIVLSAADRADLRQWSLVPNSIQMVRVFLPEGTYRGRVSGLEASGAPSGEGQDYEKIEIHRGRKTFLFFKSVR